MGLEQIVNVTISRETQAVSQAGFGTLLIVDNHNKFSERIRFYSSLTAVAADFSVSDLAYKAALAAFSQELSPKLIAIGRRTDDVKQKVRVNIVNVLNNTTYIVTINGYDSTYLSDNDATAEEISAGLTAAINANGNINTLVTATDNSGSLDVESDIAGEPFIIVVDTKLSKTTLVENENIGDSLTAIKNESNDFYAVVITSHTAFDIKKTAEWVETERKLFFASNNDTDVLTSSTTDIASYLKSKNYNRTSYFFSNDHNKYPEAAWCGLMLPNNPDTINGHPTWAFKTLSGITADNLTDSQVQYLINKNANFYRVYGGVSIVLDGKVSSGEYIDIMRGVDWLESRLQERIYSRLVNLPKLPYTNSGIAVIESEIRAQLRAAVNYGFLAADPAPTVTVPLVADIPSNDRLLRKVTGITFSGILAGAVHYVEIRGTVSV